MLFFTATINSWKHLLKDDDMKVIVILSLQWFHEQKKATINGFVIMPNHIHLLWQPLNESEAKNEFALLSFTAHQFKKKLMQTNVNLLNDFLSTQVDREYHFWERRSRTIEVMSRKIAEQKLDYIHNNPLQEKWKLALQPEEYLFSSASYYQTGIDNYGFLTHYQEII